MDFEELVQIYKKQSQIVPSENKIQETISKSKDIFYAYEQEYLLSYREFLWEQFKLIQKKWWILQILLLLSSGCLVCFMQENVLIQRSIGIIGILFVVLIIPELWKNNSCNCKEIEISTYYSLRQIYTARLLLFGIFDIFTLSAFCIALNENLNFTMLEILSQFVFPVVVTICICFGTLCNRYLNETISVILCVLWSVVWWLITANDEIFSAITFPIWIILFTISIVFMIYAVYKVLNVCNKCWEVGVDGA